MLASNIAGRTANTIACPHWLANSVQHRVSVIAATSTPANLVAKASNTSIPIVFTTGGDPVRLGLVASVEPTRRQCHGRDANDSEKLRRNGWSWLTNWPQGDQFWHAHQSEKSNWPSS